MSWARKHLTAVGLAYSEFGGRVADLLDELYSGLYHLDGDFIHRADWTASHWIVLTVTDNSYWATTDGDYLTRLVFLAHDYAIRVEIEASTHGYFRLNFSPREQGKAAGVMRGHPTLEEAVERWRQRHPAPAAERSPAEIAS